MTSDSDWLKTHKLDLDTYAFIERVGIILEDAAVNAEREQLELARQQAARELQNER